MPPITSEGIRMPQETSEETELSQEVSERVALPEQPSQTAHTIMACKQNVKRLNTYIKTLIDSAFSYALLLDQDTRILYYSDNLLSLVDVEECSSFIGMPVLEACKMFKDTSFYTQTSRRLKRLMSEEEDFFEDDTIVWPTGEKRIYRINYKRIMDDANDFDGILIFSQDVTDLRLEEVQLHMNDLLNSSALPCLIWDENGDVIAFNKGTTQFIGIADNVAVEDFRKVFAEIQPEYQPNGELTETMRVRVYREALEKGFSQASVQLIAIDGSPLYFMVNVARISWVFGFKLIVYFYDMTDVMLKEADAVESKERSKLMLDCSPMMCILRDDQGNIVDCNQAALSIMGVADKKEFCKNYFSYFPEYQPDGTKSTDMHDTLMYWLNREGSYFFERTYQTPAGELIPVESKAVRIPWKNTYYYFSFSYDLRERKANEKKMAEITARERKAEIQKQTALASNEAKSQFLANMSHEIRTPMNAVLGMSELLLQENLSERQYRYVKDINMSAMSLLEIINDILDVSKLQAGKLKLVPIHYDFNMLIDNLCSVSKFLSAEKSIEFRLVREESAPLCLHGDDIRLRQILLNLVGNAFKFTEEGVVQLEIKIMEKTIEITVSDTGIGIPADNLPTLFDAFEQADLEKNRVKKGTGLGLTITKMLIEMMGGNITVKSEHGKGSVFEIEFPKVLGDASLINRVESNGPLVHAPKANVLVVDDNSVNLNVAVGLLQLFQIEAETAGTGMEAMELVQKNEYDIVFMDHRMPGMNGTEAAMNIRALGLTMPIIALTASAVVGAREMMLAAGMDDYLPKPIIMAELSEMLKKWIPAHKQLTPASGSEYFKETEAEKQRELWDKLVQIKPLSTSIGLERVGNQQGVYEKTLRLMITEIDKGGKTLIEHVSSGDLNNFRIDAHSLKASLANIGAMDLSEKAYELEIASGKGDCEVCIVKLPEFLQDLFGLNLKLKEAFACVCSCDNPSSLPPQLPGIFENLIEAFDEIDLEGIDKGCENLDALPLGGALKEEIDQIMDAVMVMDYDSAKERILQLL